MNARRVAFLLPHMRPGGAERAVLNWCKALDRSRFAPMLMLKRAEGAFLEEVPDDVPVIDLGGARAARLPGRIRTMLRGHGVEIAYSATSAMNLALCAAARGTRTKVVISEHTSPRAYLAQAKWPFVRRAVMRRLLPRADALFVPTEAIGAELSDIVPKLPPATVIPNPVVDRIDFCRPRERTADAPLRLVSAGRLVPAKAFDILIDACALLRDRGLAFLLIIHGEGPEEAPLRARTASLGLSHQVLLAGHAADLSQRLAEADLFVLASRREGFGNVLVEAMAAGTPVLAAASDGPRGLIEDGRTGCLVPVDDAAALAAAIIAIAAAPDAAAARAAAAQETAARYDIAASAKALADSFARL
ncbi:glycosyltransferase [Novosphingopyxis sp. YJ-S2-01]|uniref:glycosyltransferase n=1 Tax=Novosphingopyxis sp. YJ-S2-01 TaxID=2794021 RepID=UPI0018DE2193|nr:glycosyltransferase [Novosphingopyxis sp. YJ-S2-01]MBH9536255.1 glycosyltransferase [Novosphingopyxis sp. YJ-S2-01]